MRKLPAHRDTSQLNEIPASSKIYQPAFTGCLSVAAKFDSQNRHKRSMLFGGDT